MIKAKELSLGCHIEHNGAIYKVKSIIDNADEGIQIDVFNDNEALSLTESQLNPIEIHEKYLKRLGFKYDTTFNTLLLNSSKGIILCAEKKEDEEEDEEKKNYKINIAYVGDTNIIRFGTVESLHQLELLIYIFTQL
ncbi:MAG: hypothetical protein GX963_07685 [Bacteroidales bacterium]|nr:hypothetical protein [Bacteroidales bacterium]